MAGTQTLGCHLPLQDTQQEAELGAEAAFDPGTSTGPTVAGLGTRVALSHTHFSHAGSVGRRISGTFIQSRRSGSEQPALEACHEASQVSLSPGHACPLHAPCCHLTGSGHSPREWDPWKPSPPAPQQGTFHITTHLQCEQRWLVIQQPEGQITGLSPPAPCRPPGPLSRTAWSGYTARWVFRY